MTFSPYLDPIRQALRAAGIDLGGLYLVGGSVRDAMLGRASHDLDFVVMADSLRTARRVADALGGAYFTLDEEFQVGRVVLTPEGQPRQVFDFVLLQGEDLEADLRQRDFTINAMAISLGAPDTLIDPLGGAQDLLKARLALCAEDALLSDPVRVLRAVRMAASFQLAIPPEVLVKVPAAVAGLGEVSAERLRDELLKVLDAPKPAVSLRLLDRFGALEVLIPEIAAMKGETQSAPHIYDVWEHSLHTVEAMEGILQLLDANYIHDNEAGGDLFSGLLSSLIGRYRQQITDHLAEVIVPDRPYRPLIFLAALLHDFTKPRHRSIEADGRIRFLGHENSGGQQIILRGEALKLSRVEIQRLSRILSDHMRPGQLAREDGAPSKRAIHRFWRANGPAGVDICLLSLADMRGIYGHTLTKEAMIRRIQTVRTLLEAWFEQPEVISPPSLLDGNDLMAEFDLAPGPQIGALLEALREAQAAGEVQTKAQALAFVAAELAA